MIRATVLQEVRQMRFEERYARRHRRALTMAEAAEILGVTEWTFRRWSGRYDTEGVEGLPDRRLGRASGRAVPVDAALRMMTWYATRYTGWTIKHFHERWQTEHGGTRSSSWPKKTLQAAGQVVRAPRRGAHRKKRPRNPLPGMMLHQDGSTHAWVPGCQWDLLVTLDDATSEIYSAFCVEEEGTLRSFRGLQEVMETQGLFRSLSTDRGSHYGYTEEAGGTVDKTRLTQGHRAVQHLGITERAAANRYLTEHVLPQHNARVRVGATEPGTAFIPWVGTTRAEILCVHAERVVAKDNTVRYQGLSLQIPQDPHRFHYGKVTVRVHAYPDGTLAVFHGPRCLARDHAEGRLLEPEGEAHRRKTPTPRSNARLIVAPRATVSEIFSARS